MEGRAPFVGRRHELSLLQAELELGTAVLLVGDAGVGKSRLTTEATRLLVGRGRRCFSAACLPLATRLPLLPVVDLVRDFYVTDGGRPFHAALEVCPGYVRADLARLLPELGGAGTPGLAQPWMLSRLFTALLHLWDAFARAAPFLLVIEDVHWADQLTRDFLTYLIAHRSPGGPGLLMTVRSNQPDLPDEVRSWARQIGMSAPVTRLVLPPLSRSEVSDLTTAVRGVAAADLVDELWHRAEGNAFFTEQLLAAGASGAQAMLSDELAELLQARVTATSPQERALVELLAVAGRPLHHDELVRGCGLDQAAVRSSLRSLSDAKLVRAVHGGTETRHVLLGEAIVQALVPAERVQLHGLVATLLESRDDPSLAAEIARHWQHADRPDEERAARVAAAEHAERIGALHAAGQAWQRAYDLAEAAACRDAVTEGSGEIALRGMAAWEAAGDSPRAEALAARASDAAVHPPRTSAALRARSAMLRAGRDRRRGVLELGEAIQALEAAGPTSDLVESHHRLYHLEGGLGHRARALEHLQLALRAGRALPPSGEYTRALASLAYEQLRTGQIEAGWAALDQARTLTPVGDAISQASLASLHVYILVQFGDLAEAEAVGREALEQVVAHGILASFPGTLLVVNLVIALLGSGQVDEAAALIDPLTDEPVTLDGRMRHGFRCWVDLHRGHLRAVADRERALRDLVVDPGPESGTEFARMRLDLAYWDGDLDTAASIIDEALPGLAGAEEPVGTANLLVIGMRVCADLVETAATRGDSAGLTAARRRAAALDAAAERSGPELFRPHPFFVTMEVLAAQWRAERARKRQSDSEQDWVTVLQRWRALGFPHRAGYAGWRLAYVALRAGNRAAASEALRAAWSLADRHVPLRGQISTLARLARIRLTPEEETSASATSTETTAAVNPLGLTARELDVLTLLTEGLTNAQIGAQLYMSPKTASVHVTSILRKLHATNRVHAATIAQRSGLVS